MSEYESVLKFENYVVDEINFKRNNKFDPKENEDSRVEFNIKKSKILDKNNMAIKIYVHIFENAEDNNYPFEMDVSITGYFVISDSTGKINFEPNAIAILYPYVRAIVTNYTINANIGAVILPAINVNKLLENKKD